MMTAFLRNRIKFVRLVNLLAAGSIAADQLGLVKKQMLSFLSKYEALYEKENITYYAHILLDLVDCVKKWGLLFNYSRCPFEHMNCQLVKLVNGTKYAQLQIVEKYYMLTPLPGLCNVRVLN